MAAATRLDLIFVLCFESFKNESHLSSLRWVLLAPGKADVGFSLPKARLKDFRKFAQSLSLEKCWRSEIQNLEIECPGFIHQGNVHCQFSSSASPYEAVEIAHRSAAR